MPTEGESSSFAPGPAPHMCICISLSNSLTESRNSQSHGRRDPYWYCAGCVLVVVEEGLTTAQGFATGNRTPIIVVVEKGLTTAHGFATGNRTPIGGAHGNRGLATAQGSAAGNRTPIGGAHGNPRHAVHHHRSSKGRQCEAIWSSLAWCHESD